MTYSISYDVYTSEQFSGSHEKHYAYTYKKDITTLAEWLDATLTAYHSCTRNLQDNCPEILEDVSIRQINEAISANPSITIDEFVSMCGVV